MSPAYSAAFFVETLRLSAVDLIERQRRYAYLYSAEYVRYAAVAEERDALFAEHCVRVVGVYVYQHAFYVLFAFERVKKCVRIRQILLRTDEAEHYLARRERFSQIYVPDSPASACFVVDGNIIFLDPVRDRAENFFKLRRREAARAAVNYPVRAAGVEADFQFAVFASHRVLRLVAVAVRRVCADYRL